MSKEEIKDKLIKELKVLDERNGIVYECPTDVLTEAVESITDEDCRHVILTEHLLNVSMGESIEKVIEELKKFKSGTIVWDEDDIFVKHNPIQETEEETFLRLKNKLWNELWSKVFPLYGK